MVLTRSRSATTRVPRQRVPAPAADVEHLADSFLQYVRKEGVGAAFQFGVYASLGVSKAVHAVGLLALASLLDAMVNVVPSLRFRYGDLKVSDATLHAPPLLDLRGGGDLKQFRKHACGQAALLQTVRRLPDLRRDGRTPEDTAAHFADRLMIVNNHWRRLRWSTAWLP